MMIPVETTRGAKGAKRLTIVAGTALLASLLMGCHSDAYYNALAPTAET